MIVMPVCVNGARVCVGESWQLTFKSTRPLPFFAAIEQKSLISNNPDFSSILQVDGKLFGVTHFEAPSPGTAYLSQYEQNAKTGAITVGLELAPDAAAWWNPCCSRALQKHGAQCCRSASRAPDVRVLQ